MNTNQSSYPTAKSERVSDTHHIHHIPAIVEEHEHSCPVEFAVYDDPELPTYIKKKGAGSWIPITKTQWALMVALYENHHLSPTTAKGNNDE